MAAVVSAAGAGSVVNVAREAGLHGSAAGAPTAASKHAVVGLTKNPAVMYGPKGLRFNAVAPDATITNTSPTGDPSSQPSDSPR